MFELLKTMYSSDHGLEVHVIEEKVLNFFYELVKKSSWSIWKPGDTISNKKTRVLIGVYPDWNPYDRDLLIWLESVADRYPIPDIQIDLFYLGEALTSEALQKYIPGLKEVVMSPAVGIWEYGILKDFGTGHKGKALLEEVFEEDAGTG